MSAGLKLAGRARLFAGRLYNHDYLWFSSTEISKVSVTLPVLHNYALCYALAGYERGVTLGSTPTYAEDLARMSLYATPAQAERLVERTKVTFNALDSVTLRTDLKPNVNSPDYGWRIYLDPLFEGNAETKPHLGYTFYLFTFDRSRPRSVFRLGKKGCPVRVQWEEIEWAQAEFSAAPRIPGHVVNPLDISGQVLRYEPVALPPHVLLRSAEIVDDWFITRGPHVIHVPKPVLERLQA